MRASRLLENRQNSERGNLGYGGCVKIKQIIAFILMLAGVVCFWLESSDKSQADWKIDALGILLVLFGLWVGKFNLKKTT
jgi:hypothetical protein